MDREDVRLTVSHYKERGKAALWWVRVKGQQARWRVRPQRGPNYVPPAELSRYLHPVRRRGPVTCPVCDKVWDMDAMHIAPQTYDVTFFCECQYAINIVNDKEWGEQVGIHGGN